MNDRKITILRTKEKSQTDLFAEDLARIVFPNAPKVYISKYAKEFINSSRAYGPLLSSLRSIKPDDNTKAFINLLKEEYIDMILAHENVDQLAESINKDHKGTYLKLLQKTLKFEDRTVY